MLVERVVRGRGNGTLFCLVPDLERTDTDVVDHLGLVGLYKAFRGIRDVVKLIDVMTNIANILIQLHNGGLAHGALGIDTVWLRVNKLPCQAFKVSPIVLSAPLPFLQAIGTEPKNVFYPPEALALVALRGKEELLAPEIMWDSWSFGLLALSLLTGIDNVKNLGEIKNERELENTIETCLIKNDIIDKRLELIIRKTIRINPTERLTIEECLALLKRDEYREQYSSIERSYGTTPPPIKSTKAQQEITREISKKEKGSVMNVLNLQRLYNTGDINNISIDVKQSNCQKGMLEISVEEITGVRNLKNKVVWAELRKNLNSSESSSFSFSTKSFKDNGTNFVIRTKPVDISVDNPNNSYGGLTQQVSIKLELKIKDLLGKPEDYNVFLYIGLREEEFSTSVLSKSSPLQFICPLIGNYNISHWVPSKDGTTAVKIIMGAV